MSSIEEPQDLVAEASGASAGEAKWTAMKELEPRFPGVTADCVTFEVVEDPDDGPVRVRAEVDPGSVARGGRGDARRSPQSASARSCRAPSTRSGSRPRWT